MFFGSKWVAFADPLQQTGCLIDLKISSLFVVTGKKTRRLRKVVYSGTRLRSYIPETKTVVVQEAPGQSSYVLKTGNGKRGSLKMVSQLPPRGSLDWSYWSRETSLRSFWREARQLRRCITWLEAQMATKTHKLRGWNSCHRSGDTSGAIHASRYSA